MLNITEILRRSGFSQSKSTRRGGRISKRLHLTEWMNLEARLQPAVVIVPPTSDGPLIQAPVIESVNGVLTASVDMVRAGIPGSGESILYGNQPFYSNTISPDPNSGAANYAAAYQYTLADGTVLPAQFPGVTLKLQQGDTLKLNITNSLADPNSAPTPPADQLKVNFHSHGYLVSPLGTSDNVYRTMNPDGSYQTSISVPNYQPSGVGWYHVHEHGYSADQVYAGLAGIMQVGDPLDNWPQYLGKYDEKIMALTIANKQQTSGGLMMASPANTGLNPSPGGWQTYVNGQLNPTMTMKPGETQIWTVGATVRNGSFNLGVTDIDGKNPWQSTVLSYDGNDTGAVPRKYTQVLPTGYVKDGIMALDPGARITFAVTAPTTPGTYYLVDNLTLKQKSAANPFAIMTITVTGNAAQEPVPVFNATSLPPDLYDPLLTIDQKRNFNFSTTGGFTINGFAFPNGPMVSIQAGQVEEWLLTNTSGVDHPFHIHQTDFAVISVNGIAVSTSGDAPYPYISLRDTVSIPAGGNVVIRFRVTSIPGKYVFHCHILPHEDKGMMMSVISGPNETQRRVALGSGVGESAGVLVQGGDGQPLGRLNPLPKSWKGGVATASGALTSDMTQDIVAGPATQGLKPEVVVYDGVTVTELTRFNPFPEYPKSGVSLAIGDVDNDGKGEIIVGKVGPGQSLVRIFHSDGTFYREVKGTLPGTFPNGVTVASADFNGDNFDDLAIGAGKGRLPYVVGLDGYSLALPEGPVMVKIFDFQAPGKGRTGVNIAGGYLDPGTVPSYMANLITAPASGPNAGKVSVWNVGTTMSESMAGMDMPTAMPKLQASLTPFGKRPVPRGLKLDVTRVGKNGLNAIAAWSSAHDPVYQSISYDGTISTISTPAPAANTIKMARRMKTIR